MGRF